MTQNTTSLKQKSLKNSGPNVAIIILNWNSWQDTIECLESLFKITYSDYSVIVVDNHSTNESIKKLRDYASGKIKVKSKFFKSGANNKPIRLKEITEAQAEQGESIEPVFKRLPVNKKFVLIKNDDNYGFAKGNNIGIKFAIKKLNPDYILLLNNDTAVEHDFLDKMIDKAETDEQLGIVGSRIPYYDVPERNWFCKGIINWFSINICYHDEKCSTNHNDYITGCVALIRTDVFKNIGYLNERLFLYFEDSDFSVRALDAGYSIDVALNAVVYHKVSATSYSFVLERAQYYYSRNRLWFVKKYCPKFRKWPSLMFLIFRLFLSIGFFALKREKATVTAIFEGYRDGLVSNL